MENNETQNLEIKKISDYRTETFSNLNQILTFLEKWNVSSEILEYIVNYVWNLANIESKYWKMTDEIKKDVKFFIQSSLWNLLYSHLWEYNIKKIDTDWKKWIDKTEEENYWRLIWEAVSQIVILWWLNNFSKVHFDSSKEDSVEWLANKVSLEKYLLWEKWLKNIWANLFHEFLSKTETELKEMQDKKFDITSSQSIKDLSLLLAKEFWDWVEDVLRFIWNISSWIILLPRYLSYRAEISSENQVIKTKAEIKLKELVEKNPSFWLIELLWEKWIELIKKIWEMFTSWTQWDIAILMVTIAWLIAWWTGAIKLGLTLLRNYSVKSARIAWRKSRIAWKTTSKNTRMNLKVWSKKVKKVWDIAWKLDDIVWGAWIGHLTWSYSSWLFEKTKKQWKNILIWLWEKLSNNLEDYLKNQWLIMWITEDIKKVSVSTNNLWKTDTADNWKSRNGIETLDQINISKVMIPEELIKKYPFLENYRENIEFYFENWKFSEKDIIWEWNYWLVIKIPYWKVLKVAKDLKSSKILEFEWKRQSDFRQELESLKKLIWPDWKPLVPSWIKIPEVRESPIHNSKWYYAFEMEYVNWFTLNYNHIKTNFEMDIPENIRSNVLKSEPLFETTLIDDGIINNPWHVLYQDDLWNINLMNLFPEWFLKWYEDWYDTILSRTIKLIEMYYPEKRDEFIKTLVLLSDRWFKHADLHWKNVMVDENGFFYIIDFWVAYIVK